MLLKAQLQDLKQTLGLKGIMSSIALQMNYQLLVINVKVWCVYESFQQQEPSTKVFCSQVVYAKKMFVGLVNITKLMAD